MYTIGYDVGSSSIKASLLKVETGECENSSFFPKAEMGISAPGMGLAEQNPDQWWHSVKMATENLLSEADIEINQIKAIGISYQMHGLVVVDKDNHVLRPSIIWCDSRAVEIGRKAFDELGHEMCLSHILNSPGNFTASKLKWVQENEPQIYEKIHKIMLPGDYIASKMTGRTCTTVSGISEGIMWDFDIDSLATFLLEYYKIEKDKIPDIVGTFEEQGRLTESASNELGLPPNIPITYRAGDQPNNAFSLNVNNPGEVAATAGTSGVVYGINENTVYDKKSRVNIFSHVNHSKISKRLGVLLCINGTGILNSWLRKNIYRSDLNYEEMNEKAGAVKIGSEGIVVLPFGNGSERILEGISTGAQISGLDFNTHTDAHIIRAGHEGIAFTFKYGLDIMADMGVNAKTIRAGNTNMFQSPVFRNTLSSITGSVIELYNTDGSVGAARGAAVGAGLYSSFEDAFKGLKCIERIEPDIQNSKEYSDAYYKWKEILMDYIK